MKVSCN